MHRAPFEALPTTVNDGRPGELLREARRLAADLANTPVEQLDVTDLDRMMARLAHLSSLINERFFAQRPSSGPHAGGENYFEKEFFIMGFFGLFNKKVNEGNTDITAPVPKTGIDSPAEYLAVVMLYCDNFEEVLQDVEQISLEAYRGFGREMHDAIDMATWKHNFGCEIYFRDFMILRTLQN